MYYAHSDIRLVNMSFYVFAGYEIRGFEKIPTTGPALIVYYHGALPVDFYYLMAKTILLKKRQIRAVGDRFLFHIPGIQLVLQILQHALCYD
jgi:1-acyl-sn-glycerol-3-phosphate acyltransferase